MAQTNEEKFLKYLGDISNKMIDETSSFSKQIKQIEQQKISFGLTNETFAKAITEINMEATKVITNMANSSAMELLKIEVNQPLLDAEIKLKEKDLELKEKDLELKDKDLILKDKELELKTKELELADKEIAIKEQELLLKTEELKLMYQKIEESKAKIRLMDAQIITEGKQQGMITSQTALVNRQTAGYADNLLIKAAEYEGSLASFAVNSAPTNSTTNAAIAAFRTTIGQIKARS
jgi:hypothetical protein